MLFGSFKDYQGEIQSDFYDDWGQWYRDTFCPDTEVISIIDLSVRGATYSERKENVRDKAIDFQALPSLDVPLSYGDYTMFSAYFEKMGRRYGLLKEFRENGIC